MPSFVCVWKGARACMYMCNICNAFMYFVSFTFVTFPQIVAVPPKPIFAFAVQINNLKFIPSVFLILFIHRYRLYQFSHIDVYSTLHTHCTICLLKWLHFAYLTALTGMHPIVEA